LEQILGSELFRAWDKLALSLGRLTEGAY